MTVFLTTDSEEILSDYWKGKVDKCDVVPLVTTSSVLHFIQMKVGYLVFVSGALPHDTV